MFVNIGRDITLYNGDCFEGMRTIPDGSVDMILCDLPYGTTQNKWDSVIPFEPMWSEFWRVCKPNAAVVLTAAQPFTTTLINSQFEHFKYEWIWRKTKAMNFQQAKNSPLKRHENICIFSRGVVGHASQTKKRMTYNPQGTSKCDKFIQRSSGGNSGHNYHRTGREKGFHQGQTNYPDTILEFGSVHNPGHPTQKPVALFEYMIRTYTNPGETVLDCTAGSCTTAVAALRTGRKSICIERDPEYFQKAKMRVALELMP